MTHAVRTMQAPAAIGPYSQAVVADALVFVSGQLPLDPTTGEIVGTTAAEQAVQSLANIEAVLGAADLGLRDVVKTTVFLADIADFAAVNEVYGQRFCDGVLPARSACAVRDLPRGAKVEIEVIAQRR